MESIGIKTPILDILLQLKTVAQLQTVRIWNGQIAFENSGQYPDFPKPAAFLEVINDVQFEQLGGGYQSADVGWRIHLCHEYYDAQDGTFEQDLPVFDLRDSIITKLSFFEPTGCGPLVRTSETQDYEHTNIYHYIIDFASNYIDGKGTKEAQGKYILKEAPTDLQLDVYPPNELWTILYDHTVPVQAVIEYRGQTSINLDPLNDIESITGIWVNSVPVKPNEYEYDNATNTIILKPWLIFMQGDIALIIYKQLA